MLRKALNLSEVPYKSGCTCSETEGRPAPFCLFHSRLGGNDPNFVDDVLFLLVSVRNSSAVSYELGTPRFAVESARRTKRGLQY